MPDPKVICQHHEVKLTTSLAHCTTLFGPTDSVFLLESREGTTTPDRYSYLGGRPSALLTGYRTTPEAQTMNLRLQTWRRPDGVVLAEPETREFTGDPFTALRDLQAKYPQGDAPENRAPLQSGLVGYFGYETAYAIEKLPDTGTNDLDLPDVAFMVVDEVLVRDHQQDKTTLYVTGRGPDAQARAAERMAQWQADLDALGQPKESSEKPASTAKPTVRAHFNREQYMTAVQQCREHILSGDVFEVCLTHRLEMDLPGSPWDLYCALREINPAPFASYMQLPGFQIVSASPERFLKLNSEGIAESSPIKGTRPRCTDEAEDIRLKNELATAEKDLAENIMIVDLVRNDLGKVCQIGSVEVPELQAIETFATVHQMVSTVRGVLKPEYDALDLVRACFPGGSMTGAPKIEAMKIIDSIEPVKRGVYSGALGFIDAGGAMDLGMIIRTIICRNGVGTFGVGGAIVADSDPGAEYDETMDKARALIAAVEKLAGGGVS